VVDLAGNINDTSERLGISTDAVQGFKYAAEQSGSSIDAVSSVLNKLNLNLASGDKSTVNALKDAGLKFKDIRAMNPEDAFLAVTDAIQKIKDPMEQVRVGTALMGKGFADVLPAVKAGFRDTANSAQKMSKDTIAALDSAGDAWATFGTNLKVWAAESYNYARGMFDKLIAYTYRFIGDAYDAAGQLAGLAAKMPGAKTLGLDQAFVDSIKGQAQWYRDAATAMDLQTESAKKSNAEHSKTPPIIGRTKDETDAATAAAKKWNDELAKYSGADAAAKAAELDKVYRALADSGKLTWQATQQITKEAAALQAQGVALSPTLAKLVTISDLVAVAQRNAAGAAKEEAAAFDRANAAAGKYLANLPTAIFKTTNLSGIVAQIDVEPIRAGLAAKVNAALTGPSFWKQAFGSSQQFGADFGNAIMGAIQGGGNVFDAAGGMIGQKLGTTIAGNLSKSFLKDGAGMLSQAFGGMLNAVLPGVGALMGPLLEKAWSGLKSLFGFGSAGRDAVKDFAASFGGFDALQLKLNELGAEGQKLWIALTQGVGKNNPEQAKAAIDAINTALSRAKDTASSMGDTAASAGYQTTAQLQAAATDAIKLWEYMRTSGQYSASAVEDAWKKAQDAIAKAGGEQVTRQQAAFDAAKKNLDTLDGQIKSLQDSIAGEAPEEVMGIVEAQARAQIDALKEQRAEAAKTLEELNRNTEQSLRDVADALNNLPEEIKVRVQLQYEGGTGPRPNTEEPPKYATGGYVSSPRVAIIGDAPEYITPTRSIGMLAREIVAAGGLGTAGTRTMQPIAISLQGRALWQGLIEVAQAEGWA
jgi:hypothetical protein